MMHALGVGLLVLSVSVSAASSVSAAKWSTVENEDGYLVEVSQRPSGFEDVRVTKYVDATPTQMIGAAWGDPKEHGPLVSLHEIVEVKPTSRMVYQQVKAPMVSDRDYVMHTWREDDAANNLFQLHFKTVDHPSYPQRKGVVRIVEVDGLVTFEPRDDGKPGAIVTYRVYSDPGGSIPAWIARGNMRKDCIDYIKRLLKRVQTHPT